MYLREIVTVSQSRPTREGAGVHLRRAFGFQDPQRHDPFLLLDDFRCSQPDQFLAGFPWHPHRGIETITYMLEGSVEHGDSLGNKGVIGSGEVQWMTAGGGIIHQEMPKPNAQGRMGGFQLWANLPAAQKMIPPRYQEFAADDFPVASLDHGASATVICGTLNGARGPVRDVEVDPAFFDVTVQPGARTQIPTPPAHQALAYVFQGRGWFDAVRDPSAWENHSDDDTSRLEDARLGNHTLIRFGPGDAIAVEAAGTDVPLRFLCIMGSPLREPIAWGGPIVMNTREQLKAAYRELEAGTFLKS